MGKFSVLGLVKTGLALYGGYKLAEPYINEIREGVNAYIQDTAIPRVREKLVDGCTKIIERTFFGVSSAEYYANRARQHEYRQDYANRNVRQNVVKQYKHEDSNDAAPSKCLMDLRRIVFNSAEDADSVRRFLQGVIDDYGNVTLADAYLACGVSTIPCDHARAHQYGWKNAIPMNWTICVTYHPESETEEYSINFPAFERI